MFFTARKISYPIQGNTEEQQGIKDGLTFPHLVLLLWEEDDLSNFSLGEGIDTVGRWCKVA
jgi:hypothetical protein